MKKDHLSQIIHTFSGKEEAEFKRFINRQRRLDKRKDLLLFNRIRMDKNYDSEDYGEKYIAGKNAYHTLRKRLYRHLLDFIVVKQIDNDESGNSNIMGLISLANYLFEKSLFKQGWVFLDKAENLASINEQYDLLNAIYKLQIEFQYYSKERTIDELVGLLKNNQSFIAQNERALVAKSRMTALFNDYVIHGTQLDFSGIIKKMLSELQLAGAIYTRPSIFHTFATIYRKVTLATKDWIPFIGFVSENFVKASEQRVFTSPNRFYHLDLLYMLAHAQYRKKDFKSCQNSLYEFEKIILEKRSHQAKFYPKFQLLQAVVWNYTGNVSSSIDLLQMALRKVSTLTSQIDKFNMMLNLAVYFFNSEKHKEANRILLSMGHSNSWFEKNLGTDWVLRKSLIEVLIHIDLDNDDIALNRIRSIQRWFRFYLERPEMSKAKYFIEFLKKLLTEPDLLNDDSYKTQVQEIKSMIPEEQLGPQSVSFYCWIRSKFERINYYELLVQQFGSS